MKTLLKIALVSAVLVFTACSKSAENNDSNTPAQPDPREAFVGDYAMSIQGDVNARFEVPLLSIDESGTFPVDYTDVALRIDKMASHADSVVVMLTIEDQQEEIHGEVIGNKLLLQPSKMRLPMADLLNAATGILSPSIIDAIRPYLSGAELELKLYHSPATLEGNTLTLTTDVQAELDNSYFSIEISGTLNDVAMKKAQQ